LNQTSTPARIAQAASSQETILRLVLISALVLSACPAFAQDEAADPGMIGGVAVSTSYNISGPMAAKTAEESAAEEQAYRRQMYALSAKECDDLLATIAKTCSVASISVSTQISRTPGTADQMYASGSVTLQVEMK
jgi:hypothetical protein